jgi:hypothetical protein
VPLLRGADEVVVGDVAGAAQIAELDGDLVDVLLRRDAAGACRLLHLLAVLVEPGEEMDFVPHQPAEPRDDVGQHLLIGVAEVRRAVGVIDRGGDEELPHGWIMQADIALRRRENPTKRPRSADALAINGLRL